MQESKSDFQKLVTDDGFDVLQMAGTRAFESVKLQQAVARKIVALDQLGAMVGKRDIPADIAHLRQLFRGAAAEVERRLHARNAQLGEAEARKRMGFKHRAVIVHDIAVHRTLGRHVRLSFVPEDRLGMGLVSNMDIIDNMMLRSYRRGRSAFLDRQPPRELAERIIEDLGVVTPNATTPVRRLSGGNVQKVLVGREIASAPTVLMAAYPVRGLDINSSYLIYHLLNQQKEKGVAVIYVGEDLDVLLALCDRVIVLSGGRVTGTVDGRTATKEEIGLLMTKAEREGESHVKAE